MKHSNWSPGFLALAAFFQTKIRQTPITEVFGISHALRKFSRVLECGLSTVLNVQNALEYTPAGGAPCDRVAWSFQLYFMILCDSFRHWIFCVLPSRRGQRSSVVHVVHTRGSRGCTILFSWWGPRRFSCRPTQPPPPSAIECTGIPDGEFQAHLFSRQPRLFEQGNPHEFLSQSPPSPLHVSCSRTVFNYTPSLPLCLSCRTSRMTRTYSWYRSSWSRC